jgi:hypothetical protein
LYEVILARVWGKRLVFGLVAQRCLANIRNLSFNDWLRFLFLDHCLINNGSFDDFLKWLKIQIFRLLNRVSILSLSLGLLLNLVLSHSTSDILHNPLSLLLLFLNQFPMSLNKSLLLLPL